MKEQKQEVQVEEIKNLKKIKVYVSERENHETQEKFNVYKALTKQGKIDLRFTQNVLEETKPLKTCWLFVEEKNVNVNQKFEYPVMWIDKIDHLEKIEFSQNLSDYLD